MFGLEYLVLLLSLLVSEGNLIFSLFSHLVYVLLLLLSQLLLNLLKL